MTDYEDKAAKKRTLRERECSEILPRQTSAYWIFSLLKTLRKGIYFATGFGFGGLAAIIGGESAVQSLFYSLPTGFAAVVLISLLYRFMFRLVEGGEKNLSTTLELILETATVIQKIGPATSDIGQISVYSRGMTQTYYAVPAKSGQAFSRDEKVIITDFLADCTAVVDDPTLASAARPGKS
jgi:hypothetical protein